MIITNQQLSTSKKNGCRGLQSGKLNSKALLTKKLICLCSPCLL